eukprot:jgi/Astpho2/7204/fgenesh1_pg.00113_%23_39_t
MPHSGCTCWRHWPARLVLCLLLTSQGVTGFSTIDSSQGSDVPQSWLVVPAEDFWDRPAGTAGTTLAAHMGAVLKGQDLKHELGAIKAIAWQLDPDLSQAAEDWDPNPSQHQESWSPQGDIWADLWPPTGPETGGDATGAPSLNSSKLQAADAAFIVAALAASGVATPHIAQDEASAVGWLWAAAAAGSLEAQAALAAAILHCQHTFLSSPDLLENQLWCPPWYRGPALRDCSRSGPMGTASMEVARHLLDQVAALYKCTLWLRPADCSARHAVAVARPLLRQVASMPDFRPFGPMETYLRWKHMDGSASSLASAVEDMQVRVVWDDEQLLVTATEDEADFRGIRGELSGGEYRYLLGKSVAANPGRALKWFREGSLDGDAYSDFGLGIMHFEGLGTPKNLTAAEAALQRGAERGHSAAGNLWGILLGTAWEGHSADPTAAAHAFSSACDLGSADACFNLGMMYREQHVKLAKMRKGSHSWVGAGIKSNAAVGLGLTAWGKVQGWLLGEPDVEQAVVAMTHAVHLGHWQAPLRLAEWHHQGAQGLQPNCTAAQEHLLLFLNKRLMLPELLERGIKAYERGGAGYWEALFRFAFLAELGSVPAQANLGWMLERCQPECLPDGGRLAMQQLLRAGRFGLYECYVQAGNMAFRGAHEGAADAGPDHELALDLYQRAAAMNDAEGLFSLAWMHARGLAVPANSTLARQLLDRALAAAPQPSYKVPTQLVPLMFTALAAWDRLAETLSQIMPAGKFCAVHVSEEANAS